MKKLHLKSLFAVGCTLALLTAAGNAAGQEKAGAVATLTDTAGKGFGTVSFTQGPHGLLLEADLENLPPGILAFHLHATGACSPDFKAAGGHLNPTNKKHGVLAAEGPHLGDMPNIHVPPSGKVQFELFLPELNLDKGDNQLLDQDGTSVIIHKQADDYKTDPAGAAGDRLACGVIKK